MPISPPPLSAFTDHERRLIRRLRTPDHVQTFLNRLPYNHETGPAGKTLRSFRGVVRHHSAHCFEAAMAAAVILEQHGFPPLVLSFESVDKLDHVLFVYREHGRWGSVGRSRDPGLHGRTPDFRSARALAMSYVDPYVDFTGCLTGFAVVHLGVELGNYNWRLSERNVWKAERMLIDHPHHPLPVSRARVLRLRERYRAFKAAYPDRRPLAYRGREHWSALPHAFTKRGYERPFLE